MDHIKTATPGSDEALCPICGSALDAESGLCVQCITAKGESVCKLGLLARIHKNERPIRQWSQSLANIAQIVALILVGIWTIRTYSHSEQRFSQTEEPSLMPHLRTGIDIGWMKIPSVNDRCAAKVTFVLENACKKAIDITQMDVDGWISSVPSKGHAPFIPNGELQQGDHFFHQSYTGTSNYLLGRLAPGGKAESSLLFHLKRDPSKRVFWKATFTTSQNLDYAASASDWDFVCNPESNHSPATATQISLARH